MQIESNGGAMRFVVEQTGPWHGHQPAVDVLFDSALALTKVNLFGVLMTGMGADGAIGLKKLHDLGYPTLAESEETCVVFGMPRVAIQLGAVDKVVPLHDIPKTLVEMWKRTQA